MSARTTRFAPSPTGHLHLGHAYAALLAYDLARASAGSFLLRIEDIDRERCRPGFETAILEDLTWLGLTWDGPVLRQSDRLSFYRERLAGLTAAGLTYPCFCTRQEIAREIARMQSAPQAGSGSGPREPTYPGTCRSLDARARTSRMAAGEAYAMRLDSAACVRTVDPGALTFRETGRGPAGETGEIPVDPLLLGDIVLGRKDVGVSYHLAVVLDDHDQGITLVTRGDDLFGATHVQRLLQAALGLDPPDYHHHRLIRDASGRRLAKRDRGLTLVALRDVGKTPAEIRVRLGLC